MKKILLRFLCIVAVLTLLVSCNKKNNDLDSFQITHESSSFLNDTVLESSKDVPLDLINIEETEEIFHFEIHDYVNPSKVSEYHLLTDDQKIAFDTLSIALDDILTNGPIPYKSYPLEKSIRWYDYKTAYNLFLAEYSAADGLISLLMYENGTDIGEKYVDSIYLWGYETELINNTYLSYKELSEETEKILSALEHDGTEYGKAYSIAKWIVDNVTYTYDANARDTTTFDTAYSAIINQEAICTGYASGFDYLCKRAGLEVIYITGYTGNIGHAWNMICIEDEWYHVDTTWMDTENDFYMYFMMPDSICSYAEHRDWEYYRHQESNEIIAPVANSFAFYQGGYQSLDELMEYFLQLPAADGYTYFGYRPITPPNKQQKKHGIIVPKPNQTLYGSK